MGRKWRNQYNYDEPILPQLDEKQLTFIEYYTRGVPVKDAMKKDNIIHIALNDVRLVSYSFNNSTGIVMNSSGFRILNILERNDSK